MKIYRTAAGEASSSARGGRVVVNISLGFSGARDQISAFAYSELAF
jgi:hypothetical protein